MKKKGTKQQRILATLIVEGKCAHIVHYVHYPERGVRSNRHGKCSRWTRRTCGLCPRHCEANSAHRCKIAWAADFTATGGTIRAKAVAR